MLAHLLYVVLPLALLCYGLWSTSLAGLQRPARARRYRIKFRCRDCAGDSLGCGEGEPFYLDADEPPYEQRLFSSREEAAAGAEEAIDGAPWEYEIEQIDA